MNKNELVAAVAQSTYNSKADVAKAVDVLFDAISGSLRNGDTVKVPGFGNFSITDRSARLGRNPRTGEPVQIAASKNPKFKAGKALKEAVNG